MEEEKPKPYTPNKEVHNIRTYLSDMAEAVRENEGSVIKIAMAEEHKRQKEVEYKEIKTANKSKIGLVIGGIMILIIAFFGIRYVLEKKSEPLPKEDIMKNVGALISYDTNSFHPIAPTFLKTDLLNMLSEEMEKLGSPSSIKALFLTKQSPTGGNMILPLSDFLSLADLQAPSVITRSIADQYMVGAYTNSDATKSDLFIILKTKDYNRAYAGMLEWEKTMLDDVFQLFHINVSGENRNLFEKPFKDAFINNKDARVLYNDNGVGVLYYIFIDKDDFIITTSEQAVKEIISRLITKNTKPL